MTTSVQILLQLREAIREELREELRPVVRAELIAELQSNRQETKPTPEKKVVKQTKPQKDAMAKRAAQGWLEVSQGKRPKLRDAIALVMAKECLNAPEVLRRLRKRSWAPNSAKPLPYVSGILTDKARFTRVKPGFYTVIATSAPKQIRLVKPAPQKKPKQPAKPEVGSSENNPFEAFQ